MSQIKVYLSHSSHDNAFSQRLAWLLRGAGADVWFDPHVRDDAKPSGATIHEMRDRMVLACDLTA